MNATKRKTILTVETRQRVVVREYSAQTQTQWCESCRAEVEMAAPEFVANSVRVKLREIYRRIEDGSLHFIENDEGRLLICIRNI